jgi:metal-dependent amidase/aminoacylase/carboxypeptidase family protein
MTGPIRTFDEDMRQEVHARIKHIAESIAEANNAKAEVRIDKAVPVTVNDLMLCVSPGQCGQSRKTSATTACADCRTRQSSDD